MDIVSPVYGEIVQSKKYDIVIYIPKTDIHKIYAPFSAAN